jgi:hypothetical protein
MRIRAVLSLAVASVAASASLASAPAATASVLVAVPPRNAFCLDAIRVGVWYQSFSGGSRRYSVSVYNPAGKLILDRRGLATTRWRYFYFRPIGFKGSVAGIYKTIYRSPSFRGPAVFRTRVYCGE